MDSLETTDRFWVNATESLWPVGAYGAGPRARAAAMRVSGGNSVSRLTNSVQRNAAIPFSANIGHLLQGL